MPASVLLSNLICFHFFSPSAALSPLQSGLMPFRALGNRSRSCLKSLIAGENGNASCDHPVPADYKESVPHHRK